MALADVKVSMIQAVNHAEGTDPRTSIPNDNISQEQNMHCSRAVIGIMVAMSLNRLVLND
jgi:hypothetical protein